MQLTITFHFLLHSIFLMFCTKDYFKVCLEEYYSYLGIQNSISMPSSTNKYNNNDSSSNYALLVIIKKKKK